MFYPVRNKEEGYIAVISAIIITAIITVIALVFSSSNFMGRFDTLKIETKDVSRKVAEGCLEYAKLKLAGGSYGGNETVAVGDYSCQILAITTQGQNTIIRSQTTINNETTKLLFTVLTSNLATVSLEEIGSF